MKTALRLAVAVLVLSVALLVFAKENPRLSPTPKIEKFEVIKDGFRLTLPKEYENISDEDFIGLTPYLLYCIMKEAPDKISSGQYHAKKERNVVTFTIRRAPATPRPPIKA